MEMFPCLCFLSVHHHIFNQASRTAPEMEMSVVQATATDQTEISQLLDGLSWNFVPIFMFPKYLKIYLMDWHQIWYKLSWFPEDEF